jgi:hypothetical protein
MPRLLLRMKRVKAQPADWFAMHQTVLALNMAKTTVANLLHAAMAPGAPSAGTRRPSHAPSPATVSGPSPGPAGMQLPASVAGVAAGGAGAGAAPMYHDRHPFVLAQFLTECSGQLLQLQTTLDNVIDWDASRSDGRLCTQVRAGMGEPAIVEGWATCEGGLLSRRPRTPSPAGRPGCDAG